MRIKVTGRVSVVVRVRVRIGVRADVQIRVRVNVRVMVRVRVAQERHRCVSAPSPRCGGTRSPWHNGAVTGRVRVGFGLEISWNLVGMRQEDARWGPPAPSCRGETEMVMGSGAVSDSFGVRYVMVKYGHV